MKKGIIYFFIGLSLLVWLVEMFTDWFDQALLRQFIRGALGFGFMIFVVFPMGMEWLKGESHDCG
ncbi:TPA: hypothetical protein ACXLXX_002111 [Streptococcus pneumoniae]|uniref:Uncharacterized protein n=1 Tax=Streptococcus pneumoniae TaxID=1313 RepID=A0AAJ5TJQ7_STREE|nr:hypothetical protein [Streptococcus pneumoniae]EDK77856.1 hypothetical protein CGSSp9BS68_00837 [Streptococcus pneumoniae SP9-BS68]EGI82576.1 putative membrane protein [Streptococcus pneumoniae GA17570]AUC46219.1 hypothetical protein BUM80_07630 [Streptococcus pneumoniae]AXJ89154.1 hypothetical protein C1H54_09865 [Streptococcus pneumoniae]EDT92136.1 conserved hypothetical protein [Streptococcus pneumoniae SP195]